MDRWPRQVQLRRRKETAREEEQWDERAWRWTYSATQGAEQAGGECGVWDLTWFGPGARAVSGPPRCRLDAGGRTPRALILGCKASDPVAGGWAWGLESVWPTTVWITWGIASDRQID